jgi:cytochrome c-type biogenesis protein CcmH
MELRLILMALVCLCIAQLAFAVESNYAFKAPQLEQRFVNLTKELRCTSCQNQNLFDSNAQIAVDMRYKIQDMLQAGSSDAEVRAYLVARYGTFILFNPPWQASTYLLWGGPALMLLLGGLSFGIIFRSRSIKNIYAG